MSDTSTSVLPSGGIFFGGVEFGQYGFFISHTAQDITGVSRVSTESPELTHVIGPDIRGRAFIHNHALMLRGVRVLVGRSFICITGGSTATGEPAETQEIFTGTHQQNTITGRSRLRIVLPYTITQKFLVGRGFINLKNNEFITGCAFIVNASPVPDPTFVDTMWVAFNSSSHQLATRMITGKSKIGPAIWFTVGDKYILGRSRISKNPTP